MSSNTFDFVANARSGSAIITARGKVSKTYMQNLAANKCTTTPTTVADNRDQEEYIIQRLADGKCYMLDNLRLDIAAVELSLLKGNSNASDAALTYLKNGGGSSPYATSGVVAKTATGGSWSSDPSRANIVVSGTEDGGWTKNTVASVRYGSGSGKIGVYYNFCAASAGSYCYAAGSATGDATSDICPIGWHIPSGNTALGSYYYLYNTSYSSNQDNFKKALSTPIVGNVHSDGSIVNRGTYSHFWSSTRSSSFSGYNMYNLYIGTTFVNPRYGTDVSNRGDGFSIRCMMD